MEEKEKEHKKSAGDGEKKCEVEEFEFKTPSLTVGLCSADEVFFEGRLLPLQPYLQPYPGVGFGSSRSSSKSSTCISRSQSSGSSSEPQAPRRSVSVSNNFYAHPSPSPQLRQAKKSNAGKKGIGLSTPGWGLFRLGVAKAPEIEISELRARRAASSISSSSRSFSFRESTKSSKSGDECGGDNGSARKRAASRFFGLGLRCRCSPDSIETGKSRVLVGKKKGEEEEVVVVGLRRGESMRHRRVFEWLEELTLGKVIVS